MSRSRESIKKENHQKHRSSVDKRAEDLNHSSKRQRTKAPLRDESPLEFVDSSTLGLDIGNLCDEWAKKDSNQIKNNDETFDEELDNMSSGSSDDSKSGISVGELESSTRQKDDDVKKLQLNLKKWAVKHQMKPSVVTSLLTVLRSHKCLESLPSDAEGVLGSDGVTKKDFNTLENLVKQQGRQITQLTTSVRRLTSSVKKPENSVEEDPFCNQELLRSLIPMKTMSDIDAMEDLLEYDDNLAFLTKILARIGGRDTSHCVRRIMRDLLEDTLTVNFSWLGRKGKSVFRGLKLNKAISNAVRIHFPKCTDQEIENTSSTWLRYAQARLRNN